MLPNLRLSRLRRRINGCGLRDLGALERANEFVLTARQADFLKVVIRGVKIDAAFLNQYGHSVARHLVHEQGENLLLAQRLPRARGLRLLGSAQRRKKCLARTCGLEALEKILSRREIYPVLLDQLRAGIVAETGPHQALYLILRQRLLLRPGRSGKDQSHRQYQESQRFAESHCDLARLSWTEGNPWDDYTENEGNCYIAGEGCCGTAFTRARRGVDAFASRNGGSALVYPIGYGSEVDMSIII